MLRQMGVLRNPEAWIAYHGSNNSPYLYFTTDGLTGEEKKLFKENTCCSAPSRGYIRVLDKTTEKLTAVHTIDCPHVKEAYWQRPDHL